MCLTSGPGKAIIYRSHTEGCYRLQWLMPESVALCTDRLAEPAWKRLAVSLPVALCLATVGGGLGSLATIFVWYRACSAIVIACYDTLSAVSKQTCTMICKLCQGIHTRPPSLSLQMRSCV